MEDDIPDATGSIDDAVSDTVEDAVEDAVDDISDTPTVIVEGDTVFEAEPVTALPTDNLELGMLVGALTARVEALEAGLNYVAEVAEDAADAADEAQADADEVADDATEAIESAINDAEVVPGEHGEPDTLAVDDVQPQSSRVHPMFRSLADWRESRQK